MALPIKDTPILTGEDARRFEEQIRRNKSQAISREDYLRAMENYRKIKVVTKP